MVISGLRRHAVSMVRSTVHALAAECAAIALLTIALTTVAVSLHVVVVVVVHATIAVSSVSVSWVLSVLVLRVSLLVEVRVLLALGSAGLLAGSVRWSGCVVSALGIIVTALI